jgi:tetratricopeptide (TPR) repeat protein
MTSNAASTSRRAAAGPASAASADAVEQAARLVEHAEELLGRYLRPGRRATARARQRFLLGDALQTVLGDYTRAMEKDPAEPAYPWNLASSLDRLGLPDLAVCFIRRAIRVAGETGDDEWAGADAHLAWADLAIRAGEPETAAIAIGHARNLDPEIDCQRYVRRLRREFQRMRMQLSGPMLDVLADLDARSPASGERRR